MVASLADIQSPCHFCYSHSQPEGVTEWTSQDLVQFVQNCAAYVTKAMSFDGEESLEYPGLFDELTQLQGVLFRSFTSNGLLIGSFKPSPIRFTSRFSIPSNQVKWRG